MKFRILVILAGSAALALGLPGALQAQSEGAYAAEGRGGFHRGGPRMGPRSEGGPEHLLQQLDQNGDGLLSREELDAWTGPQHHAGERSVMRECMQEAFPDFQPQAELAERFDTLDSNDDSFLDAGELAAARSQLQEQRRAGRGMDGEGQLSREEMRARREQGHELREALRECRQAGATAAP